MFLIEQDNQKPFSGVKFVFTGTLKNMTRSEAKSTALALGGQVMGSVSAHTTYLVVGEGHGSKLKVAQELGVSILDEQEWLALLAKYQS